MAGAMTVRGLAVALVLLLFPMTARADDTANINGALRHCEYGDDDAKAWIAACTDVISSAGTDSALLSIAYTNRGFADINFALAGDNDFSKAIADEDEAIRLNPKDDVAYLNRANARWYSGDYPRALADIEQSLSFNPAEGKGHSLRCEIYAKMNRLADAISECKQAVRLGNDKAYTAIDLAAAYEASGDVAEAIAQYRHAQSLDPDGGYGRKAVQALDRLGANAQ